MPVSRPAKAFALAVILATSCGGSGGAGSACEEAQARLDQAQEELAAAQESGDRDRLQAAIDERAAAAREYDQAC
jgi:hypothetical protein